MDGDLKTLVRPKADRHDAVARESVAATRRPRPRLVRWFLIVGLLLVLVLGLVGARRSKEDGDETGLVLSRIGWIGAAVLLLFGVLLILAALLFFGGLAALAGVAGWSFVDWN